MATSIRNTKPLQNYGLWCSDVMQTWLGCCNLKSPPSGMSESDPRQEPLNSADVPNPNADKTSYESMRCFSFLFCVSLKRHVRPLLIWAPTVRAHCQLRLKHVNTLSLLLSHSQTKINQRMLCLQAASAWSLKEKRSKSEKLINNDLPWKCLSMNKHNKVYRSLWCNFRFII